MTYRVVMAALSPGRDCQGVAGAAITLARQFDAMLLARAYCRPIHSICGDYSVPAALFQEDRRQIERHLKASEADFRAIAAKNDHAVDWQGESSTEPLSERLARESAAADIVVAGVPKIGEPHDATRQPDLCETGDAGGGVRSCWCRKPPAPRSSTASSSHGRIRARRAGAVLDALPLLAKARSVLVVEIHAADEHAAAWQSVARVSRWLARHGITAEEKVVAAETGETRPSSRAWHRHTMPT
jgi:hypothetical protein